jgi:hypothetical protein
VSDNADPKEKDLVVHDSRWSPPLPRKETPPYLEVDKGEITPNLNIRSYLVFSVDAINP